MIRLTRLAITGPVSAATPLCVLLDIANSHGIEYPEADMRQSSFPIYLAQAIEESEGATINLEGWSMQDMRAIAAFVNRSADWTRDRLAQAFRFLSRFTEGDGLAQCQELEKLAIGPQTPAWPCSLNASVLYRICRQNQIRLAPTTTIEQMGRAVELLRVSTESLHRRAMQYVTQTWERHLLLALLMEAPYPVPDPEPEVITEFNSNSLPEKSMSHEYLERLHDGISNVANLRTLIEPTSDKGAIVLVAATDWFDISLSNYPLREHKMLKVAGRERYEPVDGWLRHWWRRNKLLFDLGWKFNPMFPEKLYDLQQLRGLALREGYTEAELPQLQLYEALQLAYLSETFYLGECPQIVERNGRRVQTPIELDEIGEVPPAELLCFGQWGVALQPISMSELAELFRQHCNFTNPFVSGALFSQLAVRKLLWLAESDATPDRTPLSESSSRVRNRLATVIRQTEALLRESDGTTRRFIESFQRSGEPQKRDILDSLQALLELGMYMRGWTGSGAYPVVRAPVGAERQGEVDINVTAAFLRFDTVGSMESRQLVRELPLVIWKVDRYAASTDAHNGFTIGDRVEIARRGDNTSSIASCIRMTSNWLCASAHKYLTAAGRPAPFDIFYLTPIQ